MSGIDALDFSMARKTRLIEEQTGLLVPTEDTEVRRTGKTSTHVFQRFLCTCGTEVWAPPYKVRSGNTNSCGCLQRARAREAKTTHGESGTRISGTDNKARTRLYRIWMQMRGRCSNPNLHIYQWYGGKGVRVCEAWNDYPVFKEWAESNGYSDDLQIDRIDPDGNYEPGNCRWITKSENVSRAARRSHDDGLQ